MVNSLKHITTEGAEAARYEVAQYAQKLGHAGFAQGTAGNISLKVDKLVAITPTGAPLKQTQPNQIVLVDLEGTTVDGDYQASSELGMHLMIYQHTNAQAIVHTHSPLATAAACTISELPAIHYNMLDLGTTIKVAPFHPFGSPELAQAAVTAIGENNAALLSNHGAITIGKTLDEAFARAELLEWACKLYQDALSFGAPRVLSPEEQEASLKAYENLRYGKLQKD